MAENRALISEGVKMFPENNIKEPKDSTQNLVSGDFERQYRNRVLEQGGRRRQACCITFGVTVGVIVVWLLALTVIRQVQITRLQQEVEQLSAHIVSVEASLNSLNNKIFSNSLFNEIKSLEEDTIYTDVDDQEEFPKDNDKEKSNRTKLDKLHELTRTDIDDDTAADDEDLTYDDDQSGDEDLFDVGDYDYDRRRENSKPGTTNMELLTSEDWTEPLTFNVDEDQESLRRLQKLLNDDPENQDLALAAAAPPKADGDRNKRSVFPDAPPELIEASQTSKMTNKIEERRRSKKFPPSSEPAPPAGKLPLHTVTRTVRNSDEAYPPLVAAHFHGNTSHLSVDRHEYYKGNGLIRVAHDAAHNVWYPSPWTISAPHPRPTLTRNGHVHVHHTGVYLVYVQIYYLDSHDIISWVLHRTNVDTEGRDTLLQCAQSSHSVERIDKPNSCFSAAALYLRAGDRLAVRNTGGDRHSLMEPEKSFIGLVKLGDAVDPYQEM